MILVNTSSVTFLSTHIYSKRKKKNVIFILDAKCECSFQTVWVISTSDKVARKLNQPLTFYLWIQQSYHYIKVIKKKLTAGGMSGHASTFTKPAPPPKIFVNRINGKVWFKWTYITLSVVINLSEFLFRDLLIFRKQEHSMLFLLKPINPH